jgi:hypothetical protein
MRGGVERTHQVEERSYSMKLIAYRWGYPAQAADSGRSHGVARQTIHQHGSVLPFAQSDRAVSEFPSPRRASPKFFSPGPCARRALLQDCAWESCGASAAPFAAKRPFRLGCGKSLPSAALLRVSTGLGFVPARISGHCSAWPGP